MKLPKKHLKIFIVIFCALCVLGVKPEKFGEENAFFHGYAIEKPIIKVGLGVNLSDIKITSSSGMKIYEINSRYKLIADDANEVRIKGHREELSEKYLIQVGQTKDKKEAEAFTSELRSKIENKIYITEDKENRVAGAFQVKVGDFLTRGDALRFIKELNQIGIKECWILREEITTDKSKPHWILVNDELENLHETTVLYFVPKNRQSYLSFNGRDYRGLFVLKASPKGLVLINILNIEDYVKGVVPSELSPYDFSELEAHKAQAVAARTYAIKKLGMHEDLGFDLIDTPDAQYYLGMGAEHALSTRAVEMTRGEVALYRGKLIDALYTSTCGGMTENAENVFGGRALPYLKSTECVYEKQEETLLKSHQLAFPVIVEGRNISHLIASLVALKIIPQATNPAYFEEEASYDEASTWIKNALHWLGRENAESSPESSSLNYMTFVDLVVQSFDWEERVENLLLKAEKEFIMKDYKDWNGKESDYLAYFIQSGLILSSEKTKNPEASLTRGELFSYLGKIIQDYRPLAHVGVFKDLEKDKIKLEEEGETKELALSPDLYLLKNNEGERAFADKLYLLQGDLVNWVERDGQVQLLEVVYSPYSNVLDRSSTLHRWQVRKSCEELEKRVNQFYPIGELMDIVPQKRGESKRVVELLIIGSETQALVKGFKIRRVLGLKETLFVIDREKDEAGHIKQFVFTGKGWGHGVGLCQVGAFGMARAGAKYQDILKKYYQGIKISKIY